MADNNQQPDPQKAAENTKILEEQLELLKQIFSFEKRKQEEEQKGVVKREEANKKTLEKLNQQKSILEQNLETLKKTNASDIEILKAEQKILKTSQEIFKIKEEIGEATEEELQNLEKINEELENQKKKEEEILKAEKKAEEIHNKKYQIAKDTLKIFTDQYSSALGINGAMSSIMQNAENIGSGFANGMGGLSIVSSIFNIVGSVVGKVGEIADRLQKATITWVSSTGQLSNIADTFGASLMEFGIGVEKLTQANVDLYNGMTSFSKQSDTVKASLISNAAKMGNLGVATATTGRNFNDLTKGLKFSATEVTGINDKLAKAAIGAGIAPRKMAEEMSAAMPKMAAYGQHGVDVYIALQKAAKSLGMEMSTLTNIVGDQFDTFEGSARAAGKLNAVLGGNYLNSVDMLNASEEDRIVMLKQALDASGKSWDSMGKFERKALAATLNITDLNEAGKLFGSSTKELTKDMKSQSATQDQLTAAQEKAVDRITKQKVAEESMIPAAKELNKFLDLQAGETRKLTVEFGKLVNEGIGAAISKMTEWLEKIKEFLAEWPKLTSLIIGGLPMIGAAIGGAFIAYKSAKGIGKIKDMVGGIAGGGETPDVPSPSNMPGSETISGMEKASESGEKTSGFVKFMTNLRDGIQAWGENVGKTLKGMAVIGISIIALAGVFWAVTKILKDTESIPLETALQFGVIMGVMAAAVFGLDKLGKVISIKDVGVVILALLGLSFAFKITADAFNSFGQITDFGKVWEGLGAIGAAVAAVVALSALVAGTGGIGAVAALAVVGILAALGLALQALGKGLQDLGTGAQLIGNLLETLKKVKDVDWGAAKELLKLEDLDDVADALNDFKQEKIWAFKIFLDGLASLKAGEISGTFNALPAQINALSAALNSLYGPAYVFHQMAVYLKEVNTEMSAIQEQNITKLRAFVDTMEKTKNITVDQLKPTKEFVQIAKEYFIEQTKSKDVEKDAFIEAISGIMGNKGDKKEGSLEGKQIILHVDTKKLADAMKGYGDGRISALVDGVTGFFK